MRTLNSHCYPSKLGRPANHRILTLARSAAAEAPRTCCRDTSYQKIFLSCSGFRNWGPEKGEKAKKKRRNLEGSLRSEIEGHGRIRRPFWAKFPASSTGRVWSATRHEGVGWGAQGGGAAVQCNASKGFLFFFSFLFFFFYLSLLRWLLCCCDVCVSWFLVSNSKGFYPFGQLLSLYLCMYMKGPERLITYEQHSYLLKKDFFFFFYLNTFWSPYYTTFCFGFYKIILKTWKYILFIFVSYL